MSRVTRQRKALAESIAVAQERFDYWIAQLNDDDAVALEYFAHGMEGVIDLVQQVSNDAGYLAELLDPNVASKV